MKYPLIFLLIIWLILGIQIWYYNTTSYLLTSLNKSINANDLFNKFNNNIIDLKNKKGDELLDLEEFTRLAKDAGLSHHQDNIDLLFKSIDGDKSAKISLSELENALYFSNIINSIYVFVSVVYALVVVAFFDSWSKLNMFKMFLVLVIGFPLIFIGAAFTKMIGFFWTCRGGVFDYSIATWFQKLFFVAEYSGIYAFAWTIVFTWVYWSLYWSTVFLFHIIDPSSKKLKSE